MAMPDSKSRIGRSNQGQLGHWAVHFAATVRQRALLNYVLSRNSGILSGMTIADVLTKLRPGRGDSCLQFWC